MNGPGREGMRWQLGLDSADFDLSVSMVVLSITITSCTYLYF